MTIPNETTEPLEANGPPSSTTSTAHVEKGWDIQPLVGQGKGRLETAYNIFNIRTRSICNDNSECESTSANSFFGNSTEVLPREVASPWTNNNNFDLFGSSCPSSAAPSKLTGDGPYREDMSAIFKGMNISCWECMRTEDTSAWCRDCSCNLCVLCVEEHKNRPSNGNNVHNIELTSKTVYTPQELALLFNEIVQLAAPSEDVTPPINYFNLQSTSTAMNSPQPSTSSADYFDVQSNSTTINNSPQASTSSASGLDSVAGPSQSTSSSSSPFNPSICDSHAQQHMFYCNGCLRPLCGNCNLSQHIQHDVISFQEAVEMATGLNVQLQNETEAVMYSIMDATGKTKEMNNKIQIKVNDAIRSVNELAEKAYHLLLKRAQEYVDELGRIRIYKRSQLQAQYDNLTLINESSQMIHKMMRNSLDSSSAMELIVQTQRGAKEMNVIRSLMAISLDPCENDQISFVPTDEKKLLSSITNMGIIKSSTNVKFIAQQLAAIQHLKAQPLTPITTYVPEPSINFSQTSLSLSVQPEYPRYSYGLLSPLVVKKVGYAPTLIIGIGTSGDRDGEFCRPWGLCCTISGELVVADRSNNRIQVFNAYSGMFIRKWGQKGTAHGEFDRPAGVCINPKGKVVVVDKDNHRVQVFEIDGRHLMTFGQRGGEIGQFNYPWDVACNSQGHMAITDTRNHRIQLFNENGVFLKKFGFGPKAPPQAIKNFDNPRGIIFTAEGKILVTDFNNHRIVMIDKTLTNGRFIGMEGKSMGRFRRPQGIVCDDLGNIILCDARNNRFQVLDQNGNCLWTVGKYTNETGANPGEFDGPCSICLRPDGHVMVTDHGNHRVQIF